MLFLYMHVYLYVILLLRNISNLCIYYDSLIHAFSAVAHIQRLTSALAMAELDRDVKSDAIAAAEQVCSL